MSFQDKETFFRTNGGRDLAKRLFDKIVSTGVVPQNTWLPRSLFGRPEAG
jgi:hypothetical protein